MYANKNRNNGRRGRNTQRTPFCKVCHDAGKSKEEYSSHYVKDKPGPQGKVCCPYLLSLVCRYCHKQGHTPNHCPEVKAKENRHTEHNREAECTACDDGFTTVRTPKGRQPRRRIPRAPRKEEHHRAGSEKLAPRSIFASLEESDDEEEEYVKEEFPQMGEAKAVPQKEPVLSGWSTVAASAPVVKEKVVEAVIVPALVVKKKHATKSWADMCDTDYEDSDDEDETPLHMPTSVTSHAEPTVIRDAWYDTDEEDDYCHNSYSNEANYLYDDEDKW